MNLDENFFKTSDLHIASVLIALAYPLNRIERQSSGRAIFFFKDTPSVQAVIQDFWDQKLLVNPQTIFDALKLLKNRLHHSSY